MNNNRVETLADLLKRLIRGESPQECASAFAGLLEKISAVELAEAEDKLIADGVAVDEIQRANQLHTDLVRHHIDNSFTESVRQEDLTEIPGHPACVFKGENSGLKIFMEDRLAQDFAIWQADKSDDKRKNLLADAEELAEIIKHYERKENLMFPYLEKAGVTAPAQVMWGVDDIIRDLQSALVNALEQEPLLPRRVELVFERLTSQLESMIIKENDILLPMLMNYMEMDDWILVARESSQIGYAFNKGIEGASNSDAMTWLNKQQEVDDRPHLSSENTTIELPSGRLTPDQLTAMLNTLPTDLTFIDEADVVQYYSEGKHQVFKRTRTIIGRDVYLCHPPHLIPVIRELIRSFKNGERDSKIVAVRRGGRLDLVRYYAVRDDHGKYIGTVEVTEEISEIIEKVNRES
jgi:DUF438 domain-containing protein